MSAGSAPCNPHQSLSKSSPRREGRDEGRWERGSGQHRQRGRAQPHRLLALLHVNPSLRIPERVPENTQRECSRPGSATARRWQESLEPRGRTSGIFRPDFCSMARFALAFLFAGGPPSSISNDLRPSHAHASEITRHKLSCGDLRIRRAEFVAIPSEGRAAHSTTHHAALTPPSSSPAAAAGALVG